MVENMLMFAEEVRDRLQALAILTSEELAQLEFLRGLAAESLPAVWGIHRVVCEA
jgi:hypothetical protein